MNNNPDIVVVTIDALRTDALGCYGGRQGRRTPSIDEFSNGAIRFDNHYAVATSSLMSLYTWYTGIPPHLMPIRNLRTATLPLDRIIDLGSVLARSGYSMLTTMEERCGDPHRFPTKPTDRNYRREGIFRSFDDPPFPTHYPGMPQYFLFGIASEACPYALEWFRHARPPRFLHLWVTDLHILHRDPNFRRNAGLAEPNTCTSHPNPIAGRYYDTVALVDDSIGEFVRRIEDASDATLVVLMSDHGEASASDPATTQTPAGSRTDENMITATLNRLRRR